MIEHPVTSTLGHAGQPAKVTHVVSPPLGSTVAGAMVGEQVSLACMIAAWSVRTRLIDQLGAWNATIVAALVFLVAVVIFALVMPPLDETPEGFPAVVLWQFRMASLGAQAMLWTVLGLGFGAWVERDFAAAKVGRLQTAY